MARSRPDRVPTSLLFAQIFKEMNSAENIDLVINFYWESAMQKSLIEPLDSGKQVMPLSRIKRVMKSDEDVKVKDSLDAW